LVAVEPQISKSGTLGELDSHPAAPSCCFTTSDHCNPLKVWDYDPYYFAVLSDRQSKNTSKLKAPIFGSPS
jgi:hypothetical protein